jgi:hypothetical protein
MTVKFKPRTARIVNDVGKGLLAAVSGHPHQWRCSILATTPKDAEMALRCPTRKISRYLAAFFE